MKKHWLALALGATALASGCISSDSCVAEGAQVATPQGPRAIESLRVGDVIWAVDPRTGERVATPIVAIRSATRECLALELPDGTSLVCTPDHPIYVAEQRRFLPAVSFMEGKAEQVLQVEEHGVKAVRVRAVHADAGLHRVFDLTVESELHDFVANGVLVHNKSDDPCDPNDPNQPAFCSEESSGSPPSTAEGESTDDTSTGADSTGGTATEDGSGSSGSSGSEDGTTGTGEGSSGSGDGSTGGSSSGG